MPELGLLCIDCCLHKTGKDYSVSDKNLDINKLAPVTWQFQQPFQSIKQLIRNVSSTSQPTQTLTQYFLYRDTRQN